MILTTPFSTLCRDWGVSRKGVSIVPAGSCLLWPWAYKILEHQPTSKQRLEISAASTNTMLGARIHPEVSHVINWTKFLDQTPMPGSPAAQLASSFRAAGICLHSWKREPIPESPSAVKSPGLAHFCSQGRLCFPGILLREAFDPDLPWETCCLKVVISSLFD